MFEINIEWLKLVVHNNCNIAIYLLHNYGKFDNWVVQHNTLALVLATALECLEYLWLHENRFDNILWPLVPGFSSFIATISLSLFQHIQRHSALSESLEHCLLLRALLLTLFHLKIIQTHRILYLSTHSPNHLPIYKCRMQQNANSILHWLFRSGFVMHNTIIKRFS